MEFFDKLSEKEIRRRQKLCEIQIGLAFEQRNTEALLRLREIEDQLMQAMLRR